MDGTPEISPELWRKVVKDVDMMKNIYLVFASTPSGETGANREVAVRRDSQKRGKFLDKGGWGH